MQSLGLFVLLFLSACNAVAFRRSMQRNSFHHASIEAKQIQLPSGSMRYYDGGSGPPLVLVHGFGFGALENWQHQGPALAKRHRVIAPDLYWFGDSVPTGAEDTLQAQADSIVELLDALGLQRVDLMGSSYGGLVAARIAARSPERVDHLILVDAIAIRPTQEERKTISSHFGGARHADAMLIPGTVDELRTWLDTLFHSPSWIPRWALRQILAELNRNREPRLSLCRDMIAAIPSEDELHHVKAHALVVWGGYDPLLLPSMGERLTHTLADARMVVLSASGHAPMLEEPTRFNRIVLDFLDEPSPRVGLSHAPMRPVFQP